MARDVDKNAIDKFTEFHRFGPNKIIACPELVIPARVVRKGAAKWTTYRSNKVDPGTMQKPKKTFDYIHEHDAGVGVYMPMKRGTSVEVPAKFRPDPGDDPALVVLGKCLGFCFEDGGKRTEARSTAPYPDLLCTPDGKCLYVVQSGREVIAMMWGGALGVFARGIDG